MIAATTKLAFSALLRNKLRSTLTMLGIVIGVGAVIIMQSMGRGATAYVGEAISGLGSNMLFVIPGSALGGGGMTQGVPLFTNGDIDAIRREAPDVALVSAAGSRVLRVVYGAQNRAVVIVGVTPEFFEIRTLGVSSGRLINAEDGRQASQVCLVGKTVVDTMFGGESPLGKELRIRNLSCRVVGVLEEKGAMAGVDQDDRICMPYSTYAHRIVGSDRISALMASAVSPDRIDGAKDQITEIMRRRRHIASGDIDDFAVRDPREIQALLQTVTGILTTLLAGVAAVSLIVGGIGVMNIMLVSVTERTREIGVRLALGARARDILTQFLVESVALSAIGGVLGILFGAGVAYGVARLAHIPFVVPGIAAPIAFGVSVFVGVVFGVAPARKAARLNPLAALRFE